MGAHEVLFAIDAALVENVREGVRSAVKALEFVDHHAMRELAICLGKDGYVIEHVLALQSENARFAVSGAHGISVIESECYRPTCLLLPAQVEAMHSALAGLDASLVPTPSEDGYVEDERLETNATLRAVARQLEIFGYDPRDLAQMNELHLRIEALRAFYKRAASRGEAVICLVL